jgi:hypothetical protein
VKLCEVQVTEKVPTGNPGDSTNRLTSVDGTGGSQGWTLVLDWEKRCVFASRGELHKLVVPLDGCAYVKPEPTPVKLAKGAA